ncbi:hypothetical protein DZC78_11105 [Olleya aquimaris]|uniref:hypothetical protein n=1 Tax=Olleya sp. ITB9 TaxID=1715648 RepID=UPI0006D0F4FC|nr:hypothetical protein [Olleya sp. ITB9]AXO80909.1 hypothetical protein DZC78_11105 [Olleya aquimaris]
MKTIFTLLFATTITLSSAAELDIIDSQLFDSNPTEVIDNKVKQQVYQWTVKTTSGVFTGTADNLSEANQQIAMVTKSSQIIEKKISNINLSNAKGRERIYTWGVVTDRGYATGVSKTLNQAKQMVKLMGNLEVPKSKIIESFKTTK